MKVEDSDDIGNVAATATGNSGVEEKSASQGAKDEQTSSTEINTTELPPHSVLEMPALSPTMVRKFACSILVASLVY